MNTWSLYLLEIFTFVTQTYDVVVSYVKTTVDGIYDAHTEKGLIISSLNTYPCLINKTWEIVESPVRSRIFYPLTNKFYSKIPASKVSVDIVTANLVGDSFNKDMSLFLYEVSWALGSNPPTLYELVILYLYKEKIYIPYDILDTYTLDVLTSDAEEISIELSSNLAKEPFFGWGDDLKID
jgi:hypothetical protein